MRKLAYFFLIIFLIVSSFAVYTVAVGINSASRATAPISDLVRQLVLEATPVILPDSVTIVQEINELARLETSSYTLQKVMKAESRQDFLWGAFGEKLIFVAYGEVIAGVDLQKMVTEDLQVVDPQTVMIHLPPAEIFVATLDNEKSYVVDRQTGLFVKGDPQLETNVRRAAEAEILEGALAAGILTEANANAEKYMRGFLQRLGFENVIFLPTTPPSAPPYQQNIPKGFTGTATPVSPTP